MAVSIRTGANGSYKSAYCMWFVILPALKAGRVVVTNIEGIETLETMAERLDITFPSSTRLIRIFSRDEKGVNLWRHFYCWSPLNALIVIDECQDLFSKNIGFKMSDYSYKPIEAFAADLPKDYVDFFHSRHVPADMSKLESCEIDDRGVAEYDEQGRIIYPLTFNEGFMRHRKYDWDIELLSPDWKQIDTGIKGCAQEAFFQKSRDGFPFCKRKPYIYKHATNATTISIPVKKDPNLFSVKVPLDVHLLYKSTGTGAPKAATGTNVLFKSPRLIFVFLVLICSIGYMIYALSNLVSSDEETIQEQEISIQNPTVKQVENGINDSSKISDDVPISGDSGSTGYDDRRFGVPLDVAPEFMGIPNLKSLRLTARVVHFVEHDDVREIRVNLRMLATTVNGTKYSINEKYLDYRDIEYYFIDDCLLQLSKGEYVSLITCNDVSGDSVRSGNVTASNNNRTSVSLL